MSWLISARSSSGPIFGRFITVATIRLPENSCGRYHPIVLISGLSASRTGYRSTSRHSRSPFARAVTTYGLFSSSSKFARIAVLAFNLVRDQQHVLVPEDDVIGGERRPIRPPRTLPQQDRPDLEILRRLRPKRDLGFDRRTVGREAEQAVVDHTYIIVGVGRAEECTPPDATILADLLNNLHHQWLLGQPLFDRRQRAGLHLFRERRGFVVLATLRRGRP